MWYQKKEVRAIDANLNRVCEGLRVIEDICRFVLMDQSRQQQLKEMRHTVRAAATDSCLALRDSVHDPGFTSKGAMEMERQGVVDLLAANSKRVQEGLRTLEELYKIDDPAASVQMKGLRYQAYQVEKILSLRMGRKTLPQGLYLVLTSPSTGYESLTEMAVKAGLPAVQLRYKGDDDRELLQLAVNMREITRGSETLFIVNDRPDIGLMVEADGIHIGQEDLPVEAVRQLIGPDMLLMVDAGGSDAFWFHGYKWALRTSHMLADYDVAWFEEPLRPDAIEEYALLRRTSTVPISGGEVLTRRQTFRPWLETRALDIVQPDVTKVGGITESRRIAWMAQDHGVRFIPHGWNTAIGLAADLQLASALPDTDLVEYITGSPYLDELVVGGWQLDEDGMLAIPDAPGLGVTLDMDAVAKFTQGAWL